MKSICVFASNGLGDGFLSLVLARNLQRLGHRITLYSSPLAPLASWIPWAQVRPFMPQDEMDIHLKEFDRIVAADHSRAVGKGEVVHLDRSLSVVENFERYLEKNWGPVESVGPADLDIPSQLIHRQHANRVVIHPTSGAERRNWSAEKFIKLAHKLRSDQFEPVFMMSPAEAPSWDWLKAEGIPVAAFPNLTDAAAFVYESGFFIGNDSGLGHMASFLRVPTLSLFARASYARVWRPGWGLGIVATPTLKLPGARLKEKYWKQLLSVAKVVKKFKALVVSSN